MSTDSGCRQLIPGCICAARTLHLTAARPPRFPKHMQDAVPLRLVTILAAPAFEPGQGQVVAAGVLWRKGYFDSLKSLSHEPPGIHECPCATWMHPIRIQRYEVLQFPTNFLLIWPLTLVPTIIIVTKRYRAGFAAKPRSLAHPTSVTVKFTPSATASPPFHIHATIWCIQGLAGMLRIDHIPFWEGGVFLAVRDIDPVET
ncbi:hypothetical protein QBC46DRAFT_421782 [Diplogelasinospora grovesii]|uniref:Uncharacterized protein n=1 Tax=Diplogelasinospora grovesii TaxID=303347 RepID=A0AAN6S0T9_9PEZI|nr:hypothetical protein QBC46DRAFT_421782 [Diplogelasinospora grovesii]